MKNRYFLDTSYSIALVVGDDRFHEKAVDLSFELERNRGEIITTQAILLEIGNALAKKRFRHSALKILAQLESDTRTSVVNLTPELYDRGLDLFAGRIDKEWGLVDCISFVVMQEWNISKALTTDGHFTQAGFRALLRED